MDGWVHPSYRSGVSMNRSSGYLLRPPELSLFGAVVVALLM